MPNQRLPNSFHHENALLSDLVINETPKLRTQPHASMALEKPARKRGQFNKSTAECQTPIREIDKKTNKQPSPVPPKKNQKKKNEPTSLKSSRIHAQLNDGFYISVELRHLFQKKLDRKRCVL